MKKRLTMFPVWMVLALSAMGTAAAQQPPGSPSATTTIDGQQLPAPPQKFGVLTGVEGEPDSGVQR